MVLDKQGGKIGAFFHIWLLLKPTVFFSPIRGYILGYFLLNEFFLHFYLIKHFQSKICCIYFKVLKWFDVNVLDFQIDLWCKYFLSRWLFWPSFLKIGRVFLKSGHPVSEVNTIGKICSIKPLSGTCIMIKNNSIKNKSRLLWQKIIWARKNIKFNVPMYQPTRVKHLSGAPL